MIIEYYYAAHSAFAYLGAAELRRIAKEAGATIVHKPMDLRAVLPASGAMPFANRSKAHKEYFFHREIVRWAEHRGIDVMKKIPTHHANDINLANCILIAADQAGLDIDAFSEEILRAHWVDDADVASLGDLRKMGKAVGVDVNALLKTADSKTVKDTYAANTQEAIDRGIFGSPTYFVADDMFYGQDRLELVARALKRPYKGKWPIS